jgi:hypothetical protein
MIPQITEQRSYNIQIGEVVEAIYCGHQVLGEVVDSRCKYGTDKQYSIELLHDISFPWSGSDRKKGDILLVTNRDILSVIEV